jgi:hypothetical protein
MAGWYLKMCTSTAHDSLQSGPQATRYQANSKTQMPHNFGAAKR